MQVYPHHSITGGVGFFSVVMKYDTVENHFKTVFTLMQDHKWSWSDIQNMIPYERDVYVILLKQWIDRREEERKRLASR